MKSMKQQITTSFGLILVIVAVATCAPEPAFAKDKGRMRANHINVALGDGSVRFKAKRQNPNQQEFDRGYLSPYAANTYTGTTTVNQGRSNNLSVNGGNGNDTINVQPRTAKQMGAGVMHHRTGQRRNFLFDDYLSIYSRPKNSLVGSNTYGGTTARARVKQSH